jgi:DsbC/DsbD-like thiol-disulfide interchange protein
VLLRLLVLASSLSFAQTDVPQAHVLAAIPATAPTAKAGSTVDAKLSFDLRPGYHVNSSMPAEDYLIPLKLTWNAGALSPVDVSYPSPQLVKYSFSKVPLSVYTGEFAVTTKFQVPANAPVGPATLTGKIRYQACNDRMCLPPKNLDVKMQVVVVR